MFLLYKGFFFDIMDDPELMKNKENGNKRPCYYCFKSEKYDDIIWFVPVSTKVKKYQKIYNKKGINKFVNAFFTFLKQRTDKISKNT